MEYRRRLSTVATAATALFAVGCGDLGVRTGVGAQSGFAPIPVCSAGARTVTVAPNAAIASAGFRIKNGTPVKPDDCTYVVKLEIGFGGNSRALCSGSLVRDKMVLTAAHCVNRSPGPKDITVSVPGINAKASATHYRFTGAGATFQVETDPDFAMIYLKDTLAGASVAELGDEPLAKGTDMIALGYGYDGQGADGNGNLGTLLAGWVNVDIPATANRNMRTLAKVQPISDPRSQDTCAGDSGGPIVSATKPKRVFGWLSGGNYRNFPSCQNSADSYWQTVSVRKSMIDDAVAKGTEGATELP